MTDAFLRRLAVVALSASLVIGIPAAATAANHTAPAPSAGVVDASPTASPETLPAAETTPTESPAAATTPLSALPTTPTRTGRPTEDPRAKPAKDNQAKGPRAKPAKDNQARKMTLEATSPTEQFGDVTVTGRGFPKKQEVQVIISNGSAIYSTGYATVEANGRFSIDLGPGQPWHQGTYQVWVGYPGGTKEISLTVDDQLPSSGTKAITSSTPAGPADRVTLTGSDFAPDTTVRIVIFEEGTSNVLVNTGTTTDSTGSFSVTADPAGEWSPNTTYVVSAFDVNGETIGSTFTTPAW